MRPTRAEVNLGHLRHNLRVLKRALVESSTPEVPAPRVWGVLKADGYGHGAAAVARTLERAGIEGLCVALLEEALELREAGITIPILVMGGYYGPRHRGLDEAVEHDITPVLYDPAQVERLAALARERDRTLSCHLKLDTGMARLGAAPADADALFDAVVNHREVHLSGLMSHLACADAPDPEPTLRQLRRFSQLRERAAVRGLRPDLVHIANSAGGLAFPQARADAIRPGIALFGISPFFHSGHPAEAPFMAAAASLRPVMRVRSEVVAVRTIAQGEGVGYGHSWTSPGVRQIATIPMGYADGLSRGLSNRGKVVIRGKIAPMVGIVSMDLTTIDVSEIPGAALGDEVVVLGSQEGPLGQAAISVESIAEILGTIPWEVITTISRRVPRFFREP